MTWSDAQRYCANDVNNGTTSQINGTSHLAALEIAMEKTAVTRWLGGRDVLNKNDDVRSRIIFLSLQYSSIVLDRWADIRIAMDLVQSID